MEKLWKRETEKFVEEMKLRNFTPGTIKAYLLVLARFQKEVKRPPGHVCRENVREHVLRLQAANLTWSTVNQHTAALPAQGR